MASASFSRALILLLSVLIFSFDFQFSVAGVPGRMPGSFQF
jgi:hypothetical protein